MPKAWVENDEATEAWGQRVLDIGCGFGDTTQRLAEIVGPKGEAVGVDVAERFVEAARSEAREAGVANARFIAADVQMTEFEDRMANADTTSHILLNAGFGEIAFHRCDVDIWIGRDLDHAVQFVTALGPAGEVIRLAGDDAVRVRPQIEAALREALSEFVYPEGVMAPASTWIVAAKAP